ncbi:MAG: efflux RND transporter permease subunit, partial [Christiangramia sp.]
KFLNQLYKPSILWALRRKKLVLGMAVFLLLMSGFIYTRMGGEFIPQLDEGDFVIQPVLKTGTSLSKTIETTTRIENILIEQFPEVEQVVSRIGAAEVPTDPMSMEESDVIVSLKPKGEWVSAETKDELADKFKEALAVIPGMEIEFTQPIEMRFNELITGVRADIAIKIFGENLDILNSKAQKIKNLIRDVEGASDIVVEKIVGLPQMNVKFNREKIARYGLNISDMNKVITMGFSGETAGSVFEGEKRFDMVLRLQKDHRKDISNLKNLYVDTPSGEKVPLSELADITYQKGAAKISRDNTQRRIVVGVNVRDSDLQTVVNKIREIVDNNISLPPGYSITYGGQFENLQSATARLKVAVPIALVLIFILLYFAFGNFREAIMIFSAIPLSAVGGVLLLSIRGMPFSISAGVGFIALFGIAVLNGIVLIEHFKELREEGMENNDDLIVNGAQNRLRAVLLTASAAALGFLPMAVSTGAGAEVQRPLATVVIGGLITSTLLTLIVLPVIYSVFNKEKKNKGKAKDKLRVKPLSILLLLVGFSGFAQEIPVKTIENVNDLKEIAFKNNLGLQASTLNVDEANALIGSAFTFEKTEGYFGKDESNQAGNKTLDVMGVRQFFDFPTVYFARKKVNKTRFKQEQSTLALKKLKLEQEVSQVYYQLQYEKARITVYEDLDSLYQKFAYAAKRRFELGETNYLEKITAQSKQKQLETQLKQAKNELNISYRKLRPLVNTEEELVIKTIPLEKLSIENLGIEGNPGLNFYKNRTDYFRAEAGLEKQKLLPDISLNYFQFNNDLINDPLRGYQVGLHIPVLFFGNSSKIKAANIAKQAAELETADYKIRLNSEYNQLI